MTESEEISTIRQVIDGDNSAFATLVETWQAPLIRFLCSILKDQHSWAEDLAQDVFFEAYRRLSTYNPTRARFSTWLFTIARSRALNALKKRKPDYFAEAPEVAAQDNLSEDRESLRLLDLAFRELPPLQQRAFHLAVIEGLSHAEVAQIEGVAIGTIKSRVSRARSSLKLCLNDDEL